MHARPVVSNTTMLKKPYSNMYYTQDRIYLLSWHRQNTFLPPPPSQLICNITTPENSKYLVSSENRLRVLYRNLREVVQLEFSLWRSNKVLNLFEKWAPVSWPHCHLHNMHKSSPEYTCMTSLFSHVHVFVVYTETITVSFKKKL